MKRLHVLVATPLGKGGKGGIDRIMDALCDQLRAKQPTQLSVRFGVTRGPGSLLFSPFILLGFLTRVISLRFVGHCDLLHINVASRGSSIRKAIICRLARLLGIPYIVHLHGSAYDDYWNKSGGHIRSVVRSMFMHAGSVLVLGKTWRDFVVSEGLAAADKIVILPNAAPVARRPWQASSDNKTRILFLGVLGKRKGTFQLIEALAQLKHRTDWRAVLAGNGDVIETRRLINQHRITNQVQVPGWKSAKDVEALKADSDILVLPSFAENLPMAVIEAMAAGLAVVTTPVGATSEIIKDEETGLLVLPGDVIALAAALERLLDDTALIKRLGSAAQAFHRKHLELTTYTDRLITIWREATNTLGQSNQINTAAPPYANLP